MSTEQNFLITYGLHNFVTCAEKNKKRVFFIKHLMGNDMIHHAKSLIKGSFGKDTNIQVV